MQKVWKRKWQTVSQNTSTSWPCLCSVVWEQRHIFSWQATNWPLLPRKKRGIPGYSNTSKLLLSHRNAELALNKFHLSSPFVSGKFSCPPFQDLKANSNATALKMRPHWRNIVLLLLQTDLRQQQNHHNSVIRARIPHPPTTMFFSLWKRSTLPPLESVHPPFERLFFLSLNTH